MKNYLRYVFALLAVSLAVLLRYALLPLIGPGLPYVTLFPVTVCVALLAGLGPAILTGILGGLAADYFFITPLFTTAIDIAHLSRLAVVTITSAFVGYVGDRLRAARAKAEKQAFTLRKSEQRLKRSQEIAHLGSWELDLVNDVLTWSDEVYRIFGLQPQEFGATYEAFLEAVHPDDRAAVDAAYSGSLREGKDTYEIEHRVVRKSTGEMRLVYEKCEHVRDENGRIIRSVGMVHDVTERKRSEEELRKAKDELELRVQQRTAELAGANKELEEEIAERLKAEGALRQANTYTRSLIEASLDPLVTIDAGGRITDVNTATEKVTGHSRNELVGTDFSDYFTDPAKAKAGYQEVFQKGSVTDYALEVLHSDGHVTPVLYNAAVYHDEAGNTIGVFAAARDITERKRAEEEIRKLNKDLEARVIERTAQIETANKELEAFAYSVSHDLRAPLRSIDGFSVALLEDCADRLDDTGKDYLQRVRSATAKMGHLIDALLNLSRLSRGELKQAPIDLSSLARNVADELKKSEPHRRAEFVIADGVIAEGDPVMLQVVIENLLANAWKFTNKRDTAHIEFGLKDIDGRPAYFIKDNGTGFDMAYAGKLFTAFQRLHTPAEFPGLGIGLATVQRIIHRHGGRVWAEGEVDKGATMYFTLS